MVGGYVIQTIESTHPYENCKARCLPQEQWVILNMHFLVELPHEEGVGAK